MDPSGRAISGPASEGAPKFSSSGLVSGEGKEASSTGCLPAVCAVPASFRRVGCTLLASSSPRRAGVFGCASFGSSSSSSRPSPYANSAKSHLNFTSGRGAGLLNLRMGPASSSSSSVLDGPERGRQKEREPLVGESQRLLRVSSSSHSREKERDREKSTDGREQVIMTKNYKNENAIPGTAGGLKASAGLSSPNPRNPLEKEPHVPTAISPEVKTETTECAHTVKQKHSPPPLSVHSDWYKSRHSPDMKESIRVSSSSIPGIFKPTASNCVYPVTPTNPLRLSTNVETPPPPRPASSSSPTCKLSSDQVNSFKEKLKAIRPKYQTRALEEELDRRKAWRHACSHAAATGSSVGAERDNTSVLPIRTLSSDRDHRVPTANYADMISKDTLPSCLSVLPSGKEIHSDGACGHSPPASAKDAVPTPLPSWQTEKGGAEKEPANTKVDVLFNYSSLAPPSSVPEMSAPERSTDCVPISVDDLVNERQKEQEKEKESERNHTNQWDSQCRTEPTHEAYPPTPPLTLETRPKAETDVEVEGAGEEDVLQFTGPGAQVFRYTMVAVHGAPARTGTSSSGRSNTAVSDAFPLPSNRFVTAMGSSSSESMVSVRDRDREKESEQRGETESARREGEMSQVPISVEERAQIRQLGHPNELSSSSEDSLDHLPLPFDHPRAQPPPPPQPVSASKEFSCQAPLPKEDQTQQPAQGEEDEKRQKERNEILERLWALTEGVDASPSNEPTPTKGLPTQIETEADSAPIPFVTSTETKEEPEAAEQEFINYFPTTTNAPVVPASSTETDSADGPPPVPFQERVRGAENVQTAGAGRGRRYSADARSSSASFTSSSISGSGSSLLGSAARRCRKRRVKREKEKERQRKEREKQEEKDKDMFGSGKVKKEEEDSQEGQAGGREGEVTETFPSDVPTLKVVPSSDSPPSFSARVRRASMSPSDRSSLDHQNINTTHPKKTSASVTSGGGGGGGGSLRSPAQRPMSRPPLWAGSSGTNTHFPQRTSSDLRSFRDMPGPRSGQGTPSRLNSQWTRGTSGASYLNLNNPPSRLTSRSFQADRERSSLFSLLEAKLRGDAVMAHAPGTPPGPARGPLSPRSPVSIADGALGSPRTRGGGGWRGPRSVSSAPGADLEAILESLPCGCGQHATDVSPRRGYSRRMDSKVSLSRHGSGVSMSPRSPPSVVALSASLSPAARLAQSLGRAHSRVSNHVGGGRVGSVSPSRSLHESRRDSEGVEGGGGGLRDPVVITNQYKGFFLRDCCSAEVEGWVEGEDEEELDDAALNKIELPSPYKYQNSTASFFISPTNATHRLLEGVRVETPQLKKQKLRPPQGYGKLMKEARRRRQQQQMELQRKTATEEQQRHQERTPGGTRGRSPRRGESKSALLSPSLSRSPSRGAGGRLQGGDPEGSQYKKARVIISESPSLHMYTREKQNTENTFSADQRTSHSGGGARLTSATPLCNSSRLFQTSLRSAEPLPSFAPAPRRQQSGSGVASAFSPFNASASAVSASAVSRQHQRLINPAGTTLHASNAGAFERSPSSVGRPQFSRGPSGASVSMRGRGGPGTSHGVSPRGPAGTLSDQAAVWKALETAGRAFVRRDVGGLEEDAVTDLRRTQKAQTLGRSLSRDKSKRAGGAAGPRTVEIPIARRV
uniref:Uncharacterized protein n=1 Tax=Chromera velia CCMP2878 TaxID=1169474 RepID=A0A0G4G5C8_9ALVE|eukprot:Cvel_20266.t1-p1 / transcript=Cvel_20266.t1 / gene=Cvel_20266 / organism=Chromera_velia_CCMP2878 / gene_product=hypothetical protein / transcript_product=hypothetical protein / location=Cvel_scaffold1808:7097-16420(+) / protein_length=1651 / sequence_SO=supercontig / SO=protein_coding / is_pseudo=false